MKLGRRIGLATAVLASVILAWSAGRAVHNKTTYKAPESIDDIQARDGMPVSVGRALITNLARRAVFDAVIEPKERAVIMSNAEGNVSKIHVDEGDAVSGRPNRTLLVEIDDSGPLAVRQAADTALRDAQTNFERAEKLAKTGGISMQDMDRAGVLLENARMNAVAASNALANCRIHSPIDGIVSKRFVDPGAVVSKGKILMEIVDISSLKAEMKIREKEVPNIETGMECLVRVDAMTGRELIRTSIAAINPELDPMTRQLTATCMIDAKTPGIVPGMFAKAEVVYGFRTNVIALPEDVPVMFNGQTGVYVVDDSSTARFVPVTMGIADNGYREIAGGLQGGESIIVDGHLQVTDGRKIRITAR